MIAKQRLEITSAIKDPNDLYFVRTNTIGDRCAAFEDQKPQTSGDVVPGDAALREFGEPFVMAAARSGLS